MYVLVERLNKKGKKERERKEEEEGEKKRKKEEEERREGFECSMLSPVCTRFKLTIGHVAPRQL